jgi:hypothetical protein
LIIHTIAQVKNQTEFAFAEQLRHQRNWWSTPAISKLLYYMTTLALIRFAGFFRKEAFTE